MRIAVFGIGGVGGYFGGRLAQHPGHEVIFIARGAHLTAIQQHGLMVTSQDASFTVHPALATDDPAQAGVVDLVLVATKAWQVTDAAAAMRPLIGSETLVVPLLNGVEAPDQLAAILGEAPVLGGFCRVQSAITAPGQIAQGGTVPFIALGERVGGGSERVGRVKAALEAAGIEVRTPDSILAAMWQKLLFIASFGGVGAAARMPVGVLRTQPETRALLEQAMREVFMVARARGLPVDEDAPQQGMRQIDDFPPSATASMQRDLMEGRPSELESQNGAVVRLGAEVGVQTPTHTFIYHILLPMERRARGLI